MKRDESQGKRHAFTGLDELASKFMNRAQRKTPLKRSEDEFTGLLNEAKRAARNSYSPYSGFRVGAALRLKSGAVVTGTNVENVSYGLTICAERAALVRAVSEYGAGIRVTAIAVNNLNASSSPPCGACRQVLAEFVEPGAQIIFPLSKGSRTMRFDELFPLASELDIKKAKRGD